MTDVNTRTAVVWRGVTSGRVAGAPLTPEHVLSSISVNS
jgi:hypothetical protein